MSDLDEQEVEAEELDQEAEEAQQGADPKTKAIIDKLRRENARRRVENKSLVQTVDELTPYRAKVAEVEAKFEEAEKRYQSVIEGIKTSNDELIKGLPEDVQAIVPQGLEALELSQWLNRAAPILAGKRTPPPTEGGAGTRGRDSGTALTEQQIATAAKLKISPEEYAKHIIKR